MSNTYNLRSNKKALSSAGPKSGLKTGKSGPKSRLEECRPPPLDLKPISKKKKNRIVSEKKKANYHHF